MNNSRDKPFQVARMTCGWPSADRIKRLKEGLNSSSQWRTLADTALPKW